MSNQIARARHPSCVAIIMVAACACFSLAGSTVGRAGELEEVPNATLFTEKADKNDGDSFWVSAPGREPIQVRLYFVDCPETEALSDQQQQRVREQLAWFGIEDRKVLFEYAGQAKKFTDAALAESFTVYLGGQATSDRRYAFVMTSTGSDLGRLLVSNGLARAHGVGHETQCGISETEANSRVQDLETCAQFKKKGIWEKSDPDEIVKRRGEIRREKEEDKGPKAHPMLIDVNRATKEDLEDVPYIGPEIATEIVQYRKEHGSFKSLDDLVKVKGIGEESLNRLRDRLKIEGE